MCDETKLQRDEISRLALKHGRVHVRHGYEDGHIEVTASRGQCWIVPQYGTPRRTQSDFSIDWKVSA